MNNTNFVRGLFLMAIALVFGVIGFGYNVGTLSRAGPGMFPVLISSLVFLIGVISIIRSRFVPPVPLHTQWKNAARVLLGLCGFALISKHLSLILAIVFLVFCTTYGTQNTVMRNLKISAVLIGIAFLFRYALGLQLPLY